MSMTTETKITEQQIVQQTVEQQNVENPVEQQNVGEAAAEKEEEKFTRYCEAESFQIPVPEGATKTSYKLKKPLATCIDIFLLLLFHRELAHLLFYHYEVLKTKWAWKDIQQQKWYQDVTCSGVTGKEFLSGNVRPNEYKRSGPDPLLDVRWLYCG